MCELLCQFACIVPIRQTCPACLKLDAEQGMREELRHRRLTTPRAIQIARRRRERRRQPLAPRLCTRRAEILIEGRRAEDMQIAVGRTLFLSIGSAVLGQILPRPREPLEIARRHREIRLCQETQALQLPMARHEHDEEQQEKATQHEFCRRLHIIAVNQRDEHRGKDNGARQNIARTLRIL